MAGQGCVFVALSKVCVMLECFHWLRLCLLGSMLRYVPQVCSYCVAEYLLVDTFFDWMSLLLLIPHLQGFMQERSFPFSC